MSVKRSKVKLCQDSPLGTPTIPILRLVPTRPIKGFTSGASGFLGAIAKNRYRPRRGIRKMKINREIILIKSCNKLKLILDMRSIK